MRTVLFSNIRWETDDEDVDLPTELTLEVDDDFDVDEDGADLLSDETGFLVSGFTFTYGGW